VAQWALVWCNTYSFLFGGWCVRCFLRPLLVTLENFSRKKTLIALAAVAVSTGAMAQVTISGKFGGQIQKIDGSNGTFSMSDADINFTASEDLGGGLTATASAQMTLKAGRGNAAANEDVNLSLSGGFGTVRIGRIEAGNGIIGRGYAGAPVIGQDNGYILGAVGNVNIISYTSPSINGFQLSASTTSLNTSGTGTFAGASESIGLSYSAGALSAGIDYNNNAERTRVSASYDLGMAKVGFGYEMRDVGGSGDNYVIGVSAPLGAFTVGAAYSKNQKVRTSTTAIDGGAAFELGASYALSKRTGLSAAYVNHNSAAEAATGAGYAYRMRLTHSF